VSLDWQHGALAEGLACYRRQEFFLAHEYWEDVWRGSTEPEKTFLQALIQIAAAFHHLGRGNVAGAEKLLNAALGRLERYPQEFGGAAVGAVRQGIKSWLNALATGGPPQPLPFPVIAPR
jgi:predicted metal-dependent hydrolase